MYVCVFMYLLKTKHIMKSIDTSSSNLGLQVFA